jgi:hypothetical protein
MIVLESMVGTERFNLALQAGGRDSVKGDLQFMSRFPTGSSAPAPAGGWPGGRYAVAVESYGVIVIVYGLVRKEGRSPVPSRGVE